MSLHLSSLSDMRVGWNKIIAQPQYSKYRLHIYRYNTDKIIALTNPAQAPSGATLLEIIENKST